ncbi:MAG TPA: T9SS type A sorting domain-containing protein, partial [Chitinophagaceae bacterium]|nr:T9SS type A sorting domain-containing protein [Chitinophagaceae bacterium]
TRLDYATIKYTQPSPLLVAAGLDLTIFQGYGSLCVTLSADASGGLPPYEYSWIPGQFTTQSIQVCPTKTITYAVTAIDAGKNKAMDEVKVTVIDVRCGKNLDKVLVCHEGKKLLCIGEAEVKVHLAHGDILGACKAPPVPSDNPARPAISKLNLDPPTKFRVTNYPNPVLTTARIQYEIPFDCRVVIKVYDISGREVATLVNADKKAGYHNTDLNVSSFQSGVYYYKAILNGEKKVITRSGKIIVVK